MTASNSSSTTGDKSREEFFTIIGPAFVWLGVTVSLSVQVGFVTPYLLELGMHSDIVNYCWIAAPITGIFFQPIVGSYSDIIKRRKPFMIIGTILVIINLLLLSNSKEIGEKIGSETFALTIAIITFIALDFSINIVYAPSKALASDSVPSTKQIYSMSWYSIFGGIGRTIAFLLGAITTEISLVFAIAAVVILISTTATVYMVKPEDEYHSRPTGNSNVSDNHSRGVCHVFVNLYNGFWRLPSFLWKLMNATFWSHLGFFSGFIYLTDYYGENIMNGNVHAKEGTRDYELYKLGVQYGNFGFALQGIVILIHSYFTPVLAEKFGMKNVWIFSMIVYGLFLCLTPFINNLYVLLPIHGITGIAFASYLVYAHTIANQYTSVYDRENTAVILTILHLSTCFPQFVVSFWSGFIIDAFNQDVSSVLFVGGCCSFFAALSIWWLDTKYVQENEYEIIKQDDELLMTDSDNDNEPVHRINL